MKEMILAFAYQSASYVVFYSDWYPTQLNEIIEMTNTRFMNNRMLIT